MNVVPLSTVALASPAAGDMTEEHARLCAAVRAAGALSLTFFRGSYRSWEKRPGQPVSEADLAVDALLRERLCAGGGYGWLSEESVAEEDRLAADRVWVVDPIDGTRPFLRGLPEYAVCAALAVDGRPVLAAVYNPATEEFFDAVRGASARCNGRPLALADVPTIAGARLSASATALAHYLSPADHARVSFRKLGSIAYRLARVALGADDGAVSLNAKSDWDIAAAELIVTEAGGCVTTAAGAGLRYNGADPRHPSVIAAGPALHAALIRLLAAPPLSS